MKKLEILQMENLLGQGPHACNLTAMVLGGIGAFNPVVAASGALFGIGCYLYSM